MAKKRRSRSKAEHVSPATLSRPYSSPPAKAKKSEPPNSVAKLSSAPRLFVKSVSLLRRNILPFTKILLIYVALQFLLVRGLSKTVSINDISDGVEKTFTHSSQLTKAVASFTAYISSASASSSQASTMQPILFVIFSLAVIWILRKVFAGKAVSVKQAFYVGCAPIVPFILLLLLILVQLLPFLIGGTILTTAVVTGIATSGPEKAALFAIFLLTAACSLYFIVASLFGLFIVSLPEVTPLKAYRSAKLLVAGRRLIIIRKILFLPLVLLLVLGLLLIPIILYAKPLVAPVYDVFNVAAIIVTYTYLYMLYKELIASE